MGTRTTIHLAAAGQHPRAHGLERAALSAPPMRRLSCGISLVCWFTLTRTGRVGRYGQRLRDPARARCTKARL